MSLRIADLFCGAGGAAMGLHQAFPDAEIVGVDIAPQPRYPFEFVQADALTFPLDGYDFVWASPPCQAYTQGLRGGLPPGSKGRSQQQRPRLIPIIRQRLMEWGGPWIIENVVGAPLTYSVELCGLMFGLRVFRHRRFEAPFLLLAPSHPKHTASLDSGEIVAVYQAKWRNSSTGKRIPFENRRVAVWREAMGIDWMSKGELSQAIPPAYSRYLAQFIPLSSRRAA